MLYDAMIPCSVMEWFYVLWWNNAMFYDEKIVVHDDSNVCSNEIENLVNI